MASDRTGMSGCCLRHSSMADRQSSSTRIWITRSLVMRGPYHIRACTTSRAWYVVHP